MRTTRWWLLRIVFLLCILILLSILSKLPRLSTVVRPQPSLLPLTSVTSDMLVYAVMNADRQISVMRFDPQLGISTLIVAQAATLDFSMSANGRLAYTLMLNGKRQIYVLDTLATTTTPILVSADPLTDVTPLAWSPDGRLLAFESEADDRSKWINVWDGKNVSNVTPRGFDDIYKSFGSVSWSYDNWLTFVMDLTVPHPDHADDGEVYIWDGTTTKDLSQDSLSRDGSPRWSADGRLAFSTARNSVQRILVWDGVSYQDDLPNVSTFSVVPRASSNFGSEPVWTNAGQLAFMDGHDEDSHIQIYLWDGDSITNISQNPDANNGDATWSSDGKWAFATFFTVEQQLLYVRDANNQTILTVDGGFQPGVKAPAWSSAGYLAYCSVDRNGKVLNVWDGQRLRKIAHGRTIFAQWASADSITTRCWDG
ncbi:MAG: hypothetical protein U0528_02825 [Anaerolineae bacterium]